MADRAAQHAHRMGRRYTITDGGPHGQRDGGSDAVIVAPARQGGYAKSRSRLRRSASIGGLDALQRRPNTAAAKARRTPPTAAHRLVGFPAGAASVSRMSRLTRCRGDAANALQHPKRGHSHHHAAREIVARSQREWHNRGDNSARRGCAAACARTRSMASEGTAARRASRVQSTLGLFWTLS